MRRQSDRPSRTRRAAEISVTIPRRSPNNLPRVFVADDQEEMLNTIANTLRNEFQVVGFAGNGRELLERVPLLKPEIVVLDMFMPLVNGIEAAIRLKAAGCSSRMVFVTVNEDKDFVEAAMAVGACGYVLKPYLATDLVPAVRRALNDGVFVSPCLHATLQRFSL